MPVKSGFAVSSRQIKLTHYREFIGLTFGGIRLENHLDFKNAFVEISQEGHFSDKNRQFVAVGPFR